MSGLRVVNYNTWHGLNGKGLVSFGELEPSGRREKRYQVQLHQLRELDADLIFLQEVNPLLARSRELAQALKMDRVVQQDQAGIKFFGLGIPGNLSSGLAILAKPALQIKKVAGIKLSGARGFASQVASFQMEEFRYALTATAQWDGKSVFLMNTHLHHGPVVSDELKQKLKACGLSDAELSKIYHSLAASSRRRLSEIEKIHNVIGAQKCDAVILGGDLNVEEDDEVLNKILLQDIFKGQKLNTWDAKKNFDNHEYSRHLNLTVPIFGKEKVKRLFQDYDSRSRRIDYIFISPSLKPVRRSLALHTPINGVFGSDHFGLLAELRWQVQNDETE